MSENRNSQSMEFHCAHLGASGVSANFTGNWQSWGMIDYASVKPTMETIHEAMSRVGLDFVPLTSPHIWRNPVTGISGESKLFKDVYNPMYDEPIAESVGADFNTLSYMDTLNGIFGELLTEGTIPARFISFDRGSRMVAQFALPEEYYTAGRPVKAFFSVYTALTGKVLTRGGITSWNPVCSNTYAALLHDLTVGTKRTKYMVNRLPSLADKLGIIRREFRQTINTIDSWGIMPASSELTQAFISAMLPKKEASESNAVNNRRAELVTAIGQTANELSGGNQLTIYDLFSGVTRYVGARQQNRDDLTQYEYATTGIGGQFATQAYNWLVANA